MPRLLHLLPLLLLLLLLLLEETSQQSFAASTPQGNQLQLATRNLQLQNCTLVMKSRDDDSLIWLQKVVSVCVRVCVSVWVSVCVSVWTVLWSSVSSIIQRILFVLLCFFCCSRCVSLVVVGRQEGKSESRLTAVVFCPAYTHRHTHRGTHTRSKEITRAIHTWVPMQMAAHWIVKYAPSHMQTSLAAILQLRGQASPPRGLLDKFETLADTADDKKTSKRATKTLDYLLNV